MVTPGANIYEYTFSNISTEPPGNKQIRTNHADNTLATKMWIQYVTTDDIDIYRVLTSIVLAGGQLYLQDLDDHTRFVRWHITGSVVDKGDYVEVPIAHDISGAALLNARSGLVIGQPEDFVGDEPGPSVDCGPSGGISVGSSRTLTATFRNAAGALIDPPAVTFTQQPPGGAPTSAPATRASQGVYTAIMLLNVPGVWGWQFDAGDSGSASGNLLVYPSALDSTYTYDPSQSLGQLRLYIDDRDFSNVDPTIPPNQRSALFSDAELNMMLGTEGGSPLLAASRALTTIAMNRTLLVQRRDIDGVVVDYGSLRADLLRAARAYEDQASGVGVPADGYAEHAWNDFAARQVIWNREMRLDTGSYWVNGVYVGPLP